MEREETHDQKKRIVRLGGAIIIGLLVMAGGLGYLGFYYASHAGRGALVQSEGNPVGGSFRVASMGGSIVTDGDFRGAWLVVWFVDPHCPTSRCYPMLRRLDDVTTQLKSEGHSIVPLVVSLDMAMADSDDLKDYVMKAAPHIMPFYASPNMIRAMTALYHAPLRQEEGYYIPAPSFVLMNPRGRYVTSIPAMLGTTDLLQRFHSVMMP